MAAWLIDSRIVDTTNPEIQTKHHILAASSASEAAKAKAKEIQEQGFQLVQVQETPYCPRVKSVYMTNQNSSQTLMTLPNLL
jgi:hypothetical protein